MIKNMGRSLLVVIVALSLAACGKAANPDANKTPAGNSPAPAADGKPTAEQIKSAEQFYKGKNLRIVVGYAPGGGFDANSRLFATYLTKYIPGNPTVAVDNMAGAGSTLAANFIYKVAAKDGLTIGTFNHYQLISQISGGAGIEFDMAKFSWLSSTIQDSIACITKASSSFKKWDDVTKSTKPIAVGTLGPGTSTHDVPSVVFNVTKAPVKFVAGYKGSNELRLALESGEVDAMCQGWESMKAGAPQWFEGGKRGVNVLFQVGQEKAHDLKEIPLGQELVKDEADKKLIGTIGTPDTVGIPFAAPPGIPADRFVVLRAAFDSAIKDPDFLADAKRAKRDFQYRSGGDVDKIMKIALDLSPELKDRLKSILVTKK